MRSGEVVALTCYARDSDNCHWGRAAAEIKRQSTLNLPAESL